MSFGKSFPIRQIYIKTTLCKGEKPCNYRDCQLASSALKNHPSKRKISKTCIDIIVQRMHVHVKLFISMQENLYTVVPVTATRPVPPRGQFVFIGRSLRVKCERMFYFRVKCEFLLIIMSRVTGWRRRFSRLRTVVARNRRKHVHITRIFVFAIGGMFLPYSWSNIYVFRSRGQRLGTSVTVFMGYN